MPAALPLIAGAFLAAGSIATAVGITAGIVIAGLSISLAAVLTITGVALLAVSYLTRKTPKPESSASGQQLQQKLDPQAPVPIAYGRTATGGFITWRGTWGAKNAFYGIVTVLSAGGPISGVEAYQAGDYTTGFSGNPATSLATVSSVGGYSNGSKLYVNKLHQRWQTGEAPAATTPGGATGYPIPVGSMSGLAHVITGYEYNQEAFPSGLPASFWVLNGVKVYDPRKDSTYPGGSGLHRVDQPSTWTFSDNPFLAGLQWTLGRYENGHRVYGIGAKWEEVDVASFVAGANVADANAWKVGGVVTTSDDKFAVLASLLVAGGGVAVARGAQIACTVNAPKVSTLTITRDDIIGEVETSSSTSWRDRQNTIIPRYREETQNWEINSGERVSAASYVTEDGDTKTVEIEYPLVQQAAQAHQLAAYELVNSREFLTFNLTGKLRLIAARVGEAVTVNAPEISAGSKKCTVVGREVNPADNTVTLSLKAETDAKHAFALGQSQTAPASPKLDGYDPSNPDAPAANAWAVTATQISNGSTTLPVIVINGATDDPNATTVIVEYRPLSSTVWLPSGEYPASVTRIEVGNLTDGTVYELALSYRTVRGVVGARRTLVATAGALRIAYGSVNNTPTSLGDINSGEGGKLSGIEPGATVGGTIGQNIRYPNGTYYTPITAAEIQGQVSAGTAQLQTDLQTARTDLQTARNDLTAEVSRAKGAEGTITTTVASLSSTVGGHSTQITNEITARTTADQALADQISSIQTSSNGAGNLLSNTDFITLDGWILGSNYLTATLSINAAGEAWHPPSDNALSFHQDAPVTNSSYYVEVTSPPISVVGNQYLQFYCYTASHRSNAWVSLFYYDSGGSIVGYAGENVGARVDAGGNSLSNFDQTGVKNVQVPANATYARMCLRKYDTLAGQADSYAWFIRPYIGYAVAGQTEWNPFSPGSSKVAIAATNGRVTDEITARTNADSALSGRIDTIAADYVTNGAAATIAQGRVNSEATARANADSALSGRIDTITADYTTAGQAGLIAQAKVNTEAVARANADSALGGRIDTISADYVTNGAAASIAQGTVNTEIAARASADSALSGRIDTITADYTTGGQAASIAQAKVDVETTARANADGALAARATTLEASSNILGAKITALETVATNGTFASASSVSTLSSTVGGLSSSVSTFNSALATLNGKTQASWSVLADAGNGRAQLSVHADSYGGAGVDIVGDVAISGALVVSGTITSGKFSSSSVSQTVFYSLPNSVQIPYG